MSLKKSSRIKQLAERAGLESLAEQALVSPGAFRKQMSTALRPSESDDVYQAACDAHDAAIVYEKRLLTRSSPLLQNAVRLGIQSPEGALRDYEDQFGGRAKNYTSADSVASMFSPAAYLADLYRNAKKLYKPSSVYHIDKRRPDLKGLTLSQVNMSKEVSALSLSNEVLMASVRKVADALDNHEVLEILATWRKCGTTPFNEAYSRLRYSRIEKDPVFKQLSVFPRVTGLFTGASMAGMAFNIAPELYTILLESVVYDAADPSASNVDDLYTANFGTIEPAQVFNPVFLRRNYDLTNEEASQLMSMVFGVFGGVLSAEYNGDLLLTMCGNSFYRCECVELGNFSHARLYPELNGGWNFNVCFNYNLQRRKKIKLHLNANDGPVVCESLLKDGVSDRNELWLPFVDDGGLQIAENGSTQQFVFETLPDPDPGPGEDRGYDVVVYKINSRPLKPYALHFNKIIRLWRATGIPLQALCNIIEYVNPSKIEDLTLEVLFQCQRVTMHYGVEPGEAQAMCGVTLSQIAHDGELSQYDRIFNNPPLNGFSLEPDEIVIDLTVWEGNDATVMAVLKRAFQVDDAGLQILFKMYFGKPTTNSVTLGIKNLSSIYSLSRWVWRNGLSVVELQKLLQIMGGKDFSSVDPKDWIVWQQKVEGLTTWLKARQWSVADLDLMTKSVFDTVATNDIAILLNDLQGVVNVNLSVTDPEERKALLAPTLASSLDLPSAAVGESILTWANALKPGNWAVDDFWAQSGAVQPGKSEIAFCYGLAQFALIYHATGINAQAFNLFVVQPTRLLGGSSAALLRSLATLQALCGFADWLKGLGGAAPSVLSYFVEDSLTPEKLAKELNADPEILIQAAKQALNHTQVTSVNKLSNWLEVDSVRQWSGLSSAFCVGPAIIGDLIDLKYQASMDVSLDAWTPVADAFAAGLTPSETLGVEAALASVLSAALSGYLLTNNMNADFRSYKIDSREKLYQYMLLDNLNSAQVITSQVAEAIVSLQTFIQRVMSAPELPAGDNQNNLAVALIDPFFSDWERYNQRYSTWAGVKKLVYYPENYLDPTVRLGQTAMMNEMLQTLGQAQLNADTVGDAFHAYLNSFEEVANLRVISGYHDNLDITKGKNYFIGANQSDPREYYWRSVDETMRVSDGQFPANAWTEWRKIGLAAQPWGDCIRPVILNSRLYLCWLERQDITPSSKASAKDTSLYSYAIKVAYLRYDGNWSTPITIEVDLPNTNDVPGLYCGYHLQKSTLLVILYNKKDTHGEDFVDVVGEDLVVIYCDDDMVFDFVCAPDDLLAVNAVKYQLDTKSEIVLNNSYAIVPTAEQYFKDEKLTLLTICDIGSAGAMEEKVALTLKASADSCDVTPDSETAELFLSIRAEIIIENYLADFLGPLKRLITCLQENGVLSEGASYQCYFNYWNIARGASIFYDGFFYFLFDFNPSAASEVSFSHFEDSTIYLSLPLEHAWSLDSGSTVGSYDASAYSSQFFSGDCTQMYGAAKYENEWAVIDLYFDFGIASESISANYEINLSALDIKIRVLGEDDNYTWGLAQLTDVSNPISENSSVSVNLTNISVQNWFDEEESTELKLDLEFSSTLFACATYTLRLFRAFNSAANVIVLGTTADKAQYMQSGGVRTRLNTLFARKLVERAEAGIDTILSLATQNIQEPNIENTESGFYTFVTLPQYNVEDHGDSTGVEMFFLGLNRVGDKVSAWRGNLSPDKSIKVNLFVPYPANGWAKGNELHLQVSNSKRPTDNEDNRTVIFNYDPASDVAVVARPAADKPLPTDIVENVIIKRLRSVPMDFSGSNALYFWELFYYIPMMATKRCLQEQQFSLAEKWLSYVWSPSGFTGSRYNPFFWNVRPLLEDTSWNDTPLEEMDPDAVAQNDPMHYKVATFMHGLDLLIARGDAAYRKLERDTLAEAKVWYSQALNLLGEQPFIVNNQLWTDPSLDIASSEESAARHLKVLSLLCEGKRATLKAKPSPKDNGDVKFLPEANEVMLGYWLTLNQRMFNLRHNLTLDGQPLLLPLFAKPADPKALLNAAVSSESGGVGNLDDNIPIPLWRFGPMLDSARGLVSQLMQFGNAVQNVLERKDAESLSALLQNQGSELMASSVRLQEGALKELEAEKIILSRAKDGAQKRLASYTRLYDENINARERSAMDALTASQTIAAGAKAAHMAAAASDLVPNIFGLAGGGMKYGGVANATGIGITMAADVSALIGSRMVQEEMYRRRREEWEIQRDNAQAEVSQVEAQLAALEVRHESARMQKAYLEMQQGQAQAQLTFLQTKFSNVALYSWLRGRLSSIYFQFYDLALSRCLMAERAWHWESCESLTFIRGGGWQGTWAGLTCGEGLMLNLAQLEAAQMKGAQRMLEISRTVSLADFYRSDKLGSDSFELRDCISSLLDESVVRAGNGSNSIVLNADTLTAKVTLADLGIANDYPNGPKGLRRIKQVSVSLPALLGPYQNIQAVLTYADGQQLPPGCNSLAISLGMNDSGMFQADFNDARWLPFEGAHINEGNFTLSFPNAKGAQEELLKSLNDIILHINYTLC